MNGRNSNYHYLLVSKAKLQHYVKTLFPNLHARTASQQQQLHSHWLKTHFTFTVKPLIIHWSQLTSDEVLINREKLRDIDKCQPLPSINNLIQNTPFPLPQWCDIYSPAHTAVKIKCTSYNVHFIRLVPSRRWVKDAYLQSPKRHAPPSLFIMIYKYSTVLCYCMCIWWLYLAAVTPWVAHLQLLRHVA